MSTNEERGSSPRRTAASSRRGFIKSVATGSALAAGFPAVLAGDGRSGVRRTLRRGWRRRQVPPSDRIGLAVIGAGGMGMANVNTALRIPGVELVAACDVFDGRLDSAKERHEGIFTTRDYREVLSPRRTWMRS